MHTHTRIHTELPLSMAFQDIYTIPNNYSCSTHSSCYHTYVASCHRYSPEHGLVCEPLVGSGHVLPGQSSADICVVMMLHPPATEVRVEETGHVASLLVHGAT